MLLLVLPPAPFSHYNIEVQYTCSFSNATNFRTLEVVDRGSETHIQVIRNLNRITRGYRGGGGEISYR